MKNKRLKSDKPISLRTTYSITPDRCLKQTWSAWVFTYWQI